MFLRSLQNSRMSGSGFSGGRWAIVNKTQMLASASIHPVCGPWASVATRQHQFKDAKANEQNIPFGCSTRSITLLHEFRCSGRGRLRPRCASRPVRLLPTQRSGGGAGCRGGRAGGLRARPSLAPRPAALLGVLNPIVANRPAASRGRFASQQPMAMKLPLTLSWTSIGFGNQPLARA